MKIRFDFWDVLASLEAFLTCGHQDKGLVEILYSKGHPGANTSGTFCRYTRIGWFCGLIVVHNRRGRFYESPILLQELNLAEG